MEKEVVVVDSGTVGCQEGNEERKARTLEDVGWLCAIRDIRDLRNVRSEGTWTAR